MAETNPAMVASPFPHKPYRCLQCSVRYRTMPSLQAHRCADAPHPIAIQALRVLAPFVIRNEEQTHKLLNWWARYADLTPEDMAYIVKESMK